MNGARAYHTADLLPSGKVLVAGGLNAALLSSAELYDPGSGTWTVTGSMSTARWSDASAALLDGRVLVTGGADEAFTTIYNSAELYDPNSGTWLSSPTMSQARFAHSATLLPGGGVLVAGGAATAATELYNPGLGFNAAWQPKITSASSPLTVGHSLVVKGSGFRGVSEGSAGSPSQDSPADIPVLQLFALGNEQSTGLLSTNWSASNDTSVAVSGFPAGWALATVFVNGIPSSSSALVRIDSTLLSPIILSDTLQAGALLVTFTNQPEEGFTVLGSTNVAAPISAWSILGSATETSAGHYQYTDSDISNHPRRFYLVRSP
jgi:hypothetical protein